MKFLAILFLCLLVFSCNSDRKTDAMIKAEQAISNQQSQPKSTAQTAPNEQQAATNTAPGTSYAGILNLKANEVESAPGKLACVDISVANFRNVISMQYSLTWNPAVLKFSNVHGFQLPFLGEPNFGNHRAAQGVLTFVWIDNTLKGIDLPDGNSIYQVCFEVVGKSGEESTVAITNKPTPFESVNAEEKLLEIQASNGKVTVK